MNHHEKFQDKKEWITSKAEYEILKIRLGTRSLLQNMMNHDIQYYREAELKGIHVSCEEIAFRSKRLDTYEKDLRTIETHDICHISAKAKCDIEVERKKYEDQRGTCKDI